MATLLMDVPSVQAARAKMIQEQAAMLAEINSLTAQVNQVVGSAWVSPAANEFQQTYDTLRSQITQQLETLEQLAQALQGEIAQWEETAARLG